MHAVIDRTPAIDPMVGTGVAKEITGDIELRNVTYGIHSVLCVLCVRVHLRHCGMLIRL